MRESDAVEIAGDSVEIRRAVEKYRGFVFHDFLLEKLIELFALIGICCRARIVEEFINARTRVECDIESRVISLGRMPKGKWVGIISDDLPKEKRFKITRPDNSLFEISQLVGLYIYSDADLEPHVADKFRSSFQARIV